MATETKVDFFVGKGTGKVLTTIQMALNIQVNGEMEIAYKDWLFPYMYFL